MQKIIPFIILIIASLQSSLKSQNCNPPANDLFITGQGCFEEDAGRWEPYGSNKVETTTDWYNTGIRSLKITYVDNPKGARIFFNSSFGLSTSLTPQNHYTVICYAYVNTGSAKIKIWFDGSKSSTEQNLSTFPRQYTFNFIATSQHWDGIFFDEMNAGEVIFIDDISLVQGIINPPTITLHPQSQEVISGNSVTFSVDAHGTAPLKYQWQENGKNLKRATSSSYTISSASESMNGNLYSCTVLNSYGSVTSNSAFLTVKQRTSCDPPENDLLLPGLGCFEENTGGWEPYGTNTTETTTEWHNTGNQSLKVTYVDNSKGAILFFNKGFGLSTSLTPGAQYNVICYAYVNTGSAKIKLWFADPKTTVEQELSTIPNQYTLNFTATSEQWDGLCFGEMDTGEIIYLDDISLVQTDQEKQRGFIIVDPSYPTTFKWSGNNERYFPMGETCYFVLGAPQSLINSYIDTRSAAGFNYMRVGLFGAHIEEYGSWYGYGGSVDKPDFSKTNESNLLKLDAVFDYAATKNMNLELIIFCYGNEELSWGNTENENNYIDNMVNRYKNRNNLFMWTVVNEMERYLPNHPWHDGLYSFSSDDVLWAKQKAQRIRSIDSIHAISVHPSTWITDALKYNLTVFHSFNGKAQQLPPTVWQMWSDDAAVNVFSTQNNEGVQSRRFEKIGENVVLTYLPTTWDGIYYDAAWRNNRHEFEGPGMEDAIALDWSHGKPIINSEFGYQWEEGPSTSSKKHMINSRQAHSQETTRKKAWKIVTAGGYFAAGFAYSWCGLDHHYNKWRPEQFTTLFDFFTKKTEYWKMKPYLDLVDAYNSLLALPGIEYVAYFPRGGSNYIKLEAGAYILEWLNPKTGDYDYSQSKRVTVGGKEYFAPPNSPNRDWVLHLINENTLLETSDLNINDLQNSVPNKTELNQNYPNPFNPITRIKYQIPFVNEVLIKVYDILGKEVVTLVDEVKQPGYYEVEFDAKNLSGGIYFLRMITKDFVKTMKMIVLK